MILRVFAVICFSSFSILGCTSNQQQFSNSIEIESSEGVGRAVDAQVQQGFSAKVEGGYSLEWFSCTRNVKAPYVLMLSPQDNLFDREACKSGLVQAYLQQDFNVLAVNRPGVGKSEGHELLGDDATLSSLQGLIKEQIGSGKTLDGLWGFEHSSILAFRVARSSQFKFLVIGNGIYDWEAILIESQDPKFVATLRELQKGQEPTFAEKRSVAWDFVGLPKSVYLYQTEKDAKYPEAQAEAFRSSLAANQYQVQLFKLRSETGSLTPEIHQSVLIQVAQSAKEVQSDK